MPLGGGETQAATLFGLEVATWIEELLTEGRVDLRPTSPVPEDPILALLHNAARSLEALTQTRQAQLALEQKVEVVNETAVQAKDMAQAALRTADGNLGYYT